MLQTDPSGSSDTPKAYLLENLPQFLTEAVQAARAFETKAKHSVAQTVRHDDKIASQLLEQEQHATHGLAWLSTYVLTLEQMAHYADTLIQQDAFGPIEATLTQVIFSEYLSHIYGGIPLSQGEYIRPHHMQIDFADLQSFLTPAVKTLITQGATPHVQKSLLNLLIKAQGSSSYGVTGLDETYEAMREEMCKFSESHVVPHAHEWHLQNAYIPLETIQNMSELGVFGLTIPEDFGGLGLGKESMCVVSEELSRGYIGVGSLGTRSEIAAELILLGGTEEQQNKWLPKIAAGEILPTAVFTEPNIGSDLASLKTRAVKYGDVYHITGQKTWITHPVRADLMTVLARTDPNESGYRGLSMFLIEKSRGTDDTPFPLTGMSGGEIEVLGYRGMKEYDISFDNFTVPAENLLGGEEGQGFKQLMQTFEAARIQTAARAIGVAQNALDLAMSYAQDRAQFGKSIIHFPRVGNKIVMMAAEILACRQLTYFAARKKDQDQRCDVEAGMAKLLSARVAWASADNALQIHGGNGFALEYPISRVLCDARILNIFEGAAEIQAQVIARRILQEVA
ncbi:MAG: acyl-CoA dehydrogenase family protein [Pseudomonadota bacterium]